MNNEEVYAVPRVLAFLKEKGKAGAAFHDIAESVGLSYNSLSIILATLEDYDGTVEWVKTVNHNSYYRLRKND